MMEFYLGNYLFIHDGIPFGNLFIYPCWDSIWKIIFSFMMEFPIRKLFIYADGNYIRKITYLPNTNV